MSWMIVELAIDRTVSKSGQYWRQDYLDDIRQNAFATPRYDIAKSVTKCENAEPRVRKPTLSVDPHHGTKFFPPSVGVALGEPYSGSLVMSIACDVEIDGRVGGRKPI